MPDFAAMRSHMVEGQILPNKVTDAGLIAALHAVPRERFVPSAMRAVAYVDEDLKVADDRYLMEPVVLARLLQALRVGPEDVVLDIGCATGYSTALISRLAGTAVGLESDPALAAQAEETLSNLEYDNALVVEGDLSVGYPEQAPYDAIILQGAVASVPERLLQQLGDDGRLAAVVDEEGVGVGDARLFARHGKTIGSRPLFDAAVPPLPGFEKPRVFEF